MTQVKYIFRVEASSYQKCVTLTVLWILTRYVYVNSFVVSLKKILSLAYDSLLTIKMWVTCADFTSRNLTGQLERLSDAARGRSEYQPGFNRSACWSEKECTVYWPQFCGSVVSNFTARFLSALTVMDGTAMGEQGHLATEPQSAPLSWQAWWMQADEHTHSLYYSSQPHSVGARTETQCCNAL